MGFSTPVAREVVPVDLELGVDVDLNVTPPRYLHQSIFSLLSKKMERELPPLSAKGQFVCSTRDSKYIVPIFKRPERNIVPLGTGVVPASNSNMTRKGF